MTFGFSGTQSSQLLTVNTHNNEMKTYVLYDRDLDGKGAAYSAWKRFGDDAEYMELAHGDDRDQPPVDKLPDEPARIFVLDYSWDLQNLFDLADKHELTVIDHHESLLDQVSRVVPLHPDLCDTENGYVNSDIGQLVYPEEDKTVSTFELYLDTNRSAAVLSWFYFHQSLTPRLLNHIEDRDLWKWELENTDAILKALEAEGVDFQTIDRYAEDIDKLITRGGAVTSYRDELVDRAIDNLTIHKLEMSDTKHVFGVVNSTVLRSAIGNQVLNEKDVDAALVFSVKDLADTEIRCSLRSLDDGPHAGKMAEEFGGGGHANAAGFGIQPEELDQLLTDDR